MNMKLVPLVIVFIALVAAPVQAQCLNLTGLNEVVINQSETLCFDTYLMNETNGGNGTIIINSSNIVLDLNGSTIQGNTSGNALSIIGFTNVTIQGGTITSYVNLIFGNTLSDIIVQNMTLSDASTAGVSVTLINSSLFDNNTFRNMTSRGFHLTGSTVSINNNITNNFFDSVVSSDAILIGGDSNGTRIINNTIVDSSGSADIQFTDTTSYNVSDIIIDGNIMYNAGAINLQVATVEIYNNVRITNNVMRTNGIGIIFAGSDSLIANNTIHQRGSGTRLITVDTPLLEISNVTISANFGVCIPESSACAFGGVELTGSSHTVFDNFFHSRNDAFAGFVSGFGEPGGNLYYNNRMNGAGSGGFDRTTSDWNTTNQTGPNIMGGPNIGGNWYRNMTSVCTDPDGDGFCAQTQPIGGGSNVDLLPLISTNNTTSTIFNSAIFNSSLNFDTVVVRANLTTLVEIDEIRTMEIIVQAPSGAILINDTEALPESPVGGNITIWNDTYGMQAGDIWLSDSFQTNETGTWTINITTTDTYPGLAGVYPSATPIEQNFSTTFEVQLAEPVLNITNSSSGWIVVMDDDEEVSNSWLVNNTGNTTAINITVALHFDSATLCALNNFVTFSPATFSLAAGQSTILGVTISFPSEASYICFIKLTGVDINTNATIDFDIGEPVLDFTVAGTPTPSGGGGGGGSLIIIPPSVEPEETGPFCGDGICQLDENSLSCSADCAITTEQLSGSAFVRGFIIFGGIFIVVQIFQAQQAATKRNRSPSSRSRRKRTT